ncbi:hypothetical protein [Paraburkholderia adhaesiva]|uniref:hypothetical protein n=1 Tax=Paraburkholderia adhaesiva TaxID=2883244 RepID=UPI001F209000|nr:hypothetical protein [Paraburkholderia adhaesiva]
MSRLADVVQMLAHTPYLSAALAFTFVVLALDAWAAGRDGNADPAANPAARAHADTRTNADEPRS